MTTASRTPAPNPLKQAAIVIQRLEERIAQLEQAGQERHEPIALVGMGCRFPGGANSPQAFWDLLDSGRDAVQPLAPRWALLGMQPSPSAPRWAGLLTPAPDAFDAEFFGISPREARSLDPQQRLLLEVAWESLEDAGVPPHSLLGSRTGVFIGAIFSDYARLLARTPPDEQDTYCTTGNMLSIAAGRLSYTLGLQGPCLTIDTACSSSLAAIHIAASSLRARECDLALAGGVSLLLSAETMDATTRLQALSPDGRCRTFDATANGYVRGEGCGLVVLKRLSDARRDGDAIWAILRGSAINQDGRSTGLTTPNVLAQEALLRDALRQARIEPGAVGYIETHGTGTSLGDPIEVEALRAVFGAPRPDSGRCVLGALKTNLGHLEAAAGVAGVIKAVLALQRERIPKNLNFRTLNPRIRIEGTALALATEAQPWPRTKQPRFAGVSSFGLSGTNLHLLLEEAPAPISKPPVPERTTNLFLISAKSPTALAEQAARLATHLRAQPTLSPSEVAYSLLATRSPLPHRLAVVATTRDDLAATLDLAAQGQTGSRAVRGLAAAARKKLAFLFSGQGAQAAGMGRDLCASSLAFREAFLRCAALFDRELARPLREVMWAEPGSADFDRLDQTAYTQPALFTLGYALAAQWAAWGVRPDFVAGHSIGEITAACVAGVFSLEDAVRLVAARGRLMQALPAGGAMVAIAASEAEVAAALRSDAALVSIAAVNAPQRVVIAGAEPQVQAIASAFAARGVHTKSLRVSHAFHSPLIEPMLASFARQAEAVTYHPPTCPLVSTRHGRLVGDEILTPTYWVRQAREAVRFADAMATLHQAETDTFVELGPRGVLLGLAGECLPEADVELLPSLSAAHDEDTSMLRALGSLFCRGHKIAAATLFPEGGRRVPLPTYPFSRQRHWVDVSAASTASPTAKGSTGRFSLSGVELSLPGAEVHHVLTLGTRHQPYLGDHRVFGEVVVPGAFHVSVILAIAEKRWPAQALAVEDVEFLRAIVLAPSEELELHAVLTPAATGEGYRFELSTQAEPGAPWRTHARGRVRPHSGSASLLPTPEALSARVSRAIDETELLSWLTTMRIDWGPRWRWLQQIGIGSGAAVAKLVPSDSATAGVAPLHPTLLDSGFGLAVLASLAQAPDGTPHVPFSVERLRWWRAAQGEIRCGLLRRDATLGVADFVLTDPDGVVAEITGFAFRPAQREAFPRGAAAPGPPEMYQLAWRDAVPPGVRDPERAGRWIIVSAAGAADARTQSLPSCVCTTPQALATALKQESAVAGVVCLWDAKPGEEPPATALRVATEGLQVVQALLHKAAVRLYWVTHGAVAVHEGEPIRAGTASIWGLGRTVMQEHPELGCTLIDLDAGEGTLGRLVSELLASDGETQVAWRGRRRLVARLMRRDPDARAARPRLDPASTVLITGGLGALGLRIAGWFARQGVRHLLLLGRRGLHGATDAAVAELRGLGAQVTVAAADVADRGALQAVLASIPSDLPLRGVVHAAGVIEDGVLTEQTAASMARVLAPKVVGAWNLHELTRGHGLDLFVAFSSAAGLLGSVGQANYAAANSFLDALAAQRRAEGQVGQSLAWGAWSDVGLAADMEEELKRRLNRRGMGWLRPEAGLAAWEQALGHPEASLGLMVLDLDALQRGFGATVPPVWRALLPEPLRPPLPAASQGWSAELAVLTPARRFDEVREAVRADVAQVLGLPAGSAVQTDRALAEFGMDSLMAVELRNVLGRRVGATLPATLAFDHPTVDALARWLVDEVLAAAPPPPQAETTSADAADEPIAIIGMACRFPGQVDSPQAFWRLLDSGGDAITEVPAERWNIDEWYDPDPDAPGKMTTRWGGFVQNLDRFDARFFGISPREAECIDPQARMLLETSWEALEHAGQTQAQLMGSDAGVYVGLCGNEYQAQTTADARAINAYSFLGTVHSAMVGRLSYFLGLKGPNLAVDTACSSSLVAVHLACQALRQSECRMALAGGANVILSPESTVYFSRVRAMSPTGRCHTFSADADGYVRSEGCGIVVLKRLSDALRDGDRIHAVIRASAINQDGRSNGLTAPNGPAQEAVLRRALALASLSPAEIDYVECHGTGTTLGDPIEVQALAAVLGQGRPSHKPLLLGSVKTNIGHTEGAAGVAGLIKAVLALQHGSIPKSLHFRSPNPYIPWADLNVSVAADSVPWPRRDSPRRAGVSSIGLSGTNAHVVLEEAPPSEPPATPEPRSAELLLLSAKSEEALREQALRLRQHLEQPSEDRLGDVAFSLATRRSALEHRLAIVAASRQQAASRLAAVLADDSSTSLLRGSVAAKRGKLAFLFPGQGAQRLGMGRGLYATWPVFAAAFDECAKRFDAELDRPLREVMWADPGSEAAARLDQTAYTQPALFSLGYALHALWQSWGVQPDLLGGHSVGELVAACVAGVFSLSDAVKLVAARGRLMQALPSGGAMISIAAPPDAVERELAAQTGRVVIAATNGPTLVVVSGDTAAVESVAAVFAARGAQTKRLVVSHAFHSQHMDPMLDAFAQVAQQVTFAPPNRPLISNLSGQLAGEDLRRPEYWVRHVREAVRFAEGVRALAAAGAETFVELGPRPVLLGLVPACLDAVDAALVPSLRAEHDEPEAMLEALGALYVRGATLDGSGVFGARARWVDLPTYPWQRERFWVEPSSRQPQPLSPNGRFLCSGRRLRLPGAAIQHVLTLREQQPEFLAHHVVFGKVVVAGAFYLSVILSIAAEHWPDRAIELSEVEFLRSIALEPAQQVELHAVLTPDGAAEDHRFELLTAASQAGEPQWISHARGRVRPSTAQPVARIDLVALAKRVTTPVDEAAVFSKLAAMHVNWGPQWRWLRDGHIGDGALATLLPMSPDIAAVAPLHPILLDNGFVVSNLGSLLAHDDSTPQLPFSVEKLRWWRAPQGAARCGGSPRAQDRDVSDFVLADADGIVAEVEGLASRRAPLSAFLPPDTALAGDFYHLDWTVAPLADAGQPAAAQRWIIVAATGSARAHDLHRRLPSSLLVTAANLDSALAQAGQVAGVLCIWEADPEESPAQAAQRLTITGLQVAKTLLGRAAGRLWWVTTEAVAVAPGDAVAVAGCALWGLGRALSQEHPELGCTLIDLALVAGGDGADPLLHELSAGDEETQVAWRGATRYVARLVRSRADSQRETPVSATLGPVLITGGLGALGQQVARWLASQGVQQLILTGRRGMQSPGAQALCAELESLGTTVTVAAVDASDRQALAHLLASLPTDARLAGVVHAAGVLDDGVLAEQTAERFQRVLAPKVQGAWNLHELTRDQPLRFFVMFSSIAGLLGSAGQGSYAAANSFLDGLAAHRRALGLVGQSLCWGPWAQAGMASTLRAALRSRQERRGIKALSPQAGLNRFDHALRRSEPQLAVVQLDLATLASSLGDTVPPLWRALLARPPTRGPEKPAWLARLSLLPAGQREAEVRALVREEVARVLSLRGVSQVPLDKPLSELGMDSLLAVELRNKLGLRLGATLPATLAFNHPTPAAIATFLLDQVLLPTQAAPPVQAEPRSDAEIRRALASISIAELRNSELLGPLLKLARTEVSEPAKDAIAAIDEMGADELLARFAGDAESALRDEGNQDE